MNAGLEKYMMATPYSFIKAEMIQEAPHIIEIHVRIGLSAQNFFEQFVVFCHLFSLTERGAERSASAAARSAVRSCCCVHPAWA
jgi:fructose-bisphosphate aldolase class 1